MLWLFGWVISVRWRVYWQARVGEGGLEVRAELAC